MIPFLMLQISYADMLTKVDPLRNELKSLEIEAQASRIKVRNACFYSTTNEHERSRDYACKWYMKLVLALCYPTMKERVG